MATVVCENVNYHQMFECQRCDSSFTVYGDREIQWCPSCGVKFDVFALTLPKEREVYRNMESYVRIQAQVVGIYPDWDNEDKMGEHIIDSVNVYDADTRQLFMRRLREAQAHKSYYGTPGKVTIKHKFVVMGTNT